METETELERDRDPSTAHERSTRITLSVIKEPNTEKQERIVDALTSVSESIETDDPLEFREELVSRAEEYLHDEYDVDQQRSYIWQIFARYVHVNVTQMESTDGGNPTLKRKNDEWYVNVDDDELELNTFMKIYSLSRSDAAQA